MQQLIFGATTVDVVQKNIKNLHLSVYPPAGRVRISAPIRMKLDTIRVFVLSKLGWIKKQQARLKNQKREVPREFLDRESHYFNGKRYLLRVEEVNAPPKVALQHSIIELTVRPNTNTTRREQILDDWYRAKLKETLPNLIKKWEGKMGVNVQEFRIRKMKTRWGTCISRARRIWLNLELAKKPAECLEYVVVHEMAHLLERGHGDKFVSLMDKLMPKWRFFRAELNRLPISYASWKH